MTFAVLQLQLIFLVQYFANTIIFCTFKIFSAATYKYNLYTVIYRRVLKNSNVSLQRFTVYGRDVLSVLFQLSIFKQFYKKNQNDKSAI